MLEDVPDGLQQPVHADWLVVLIAGLSRKGFGAWVEIVLPPEVLLDLLLLLAQFLGD